MSERSIGAFSDLIRLGLAQGGAPLSQTQVLRNTQVAPSGHILVVFLSTWVWLNKTTPARALPVNSKTVESWKIGRNSCILAIHKEAGFGVGAKEAVKR